MPFALLQKKVTAKQLASTRPRTAAEWRQNGVGTALDKGIDIAGVVMVRSVARVDPYRRDNVARDLRRRVKESLDKAGVPLAPPAAPTTSPIA